MYTDIACVAAPRICPPGARAKIIRFLSNPDSRGARLTPGSGMNNTEADTLLARLHADLLPYAAGVRRRLSASEKYIIGFKDWSAKGPLRSVTVPAGIGCRVILLAEKRKCLGE